MKTPHLKARVTQTLSTAAVLLALGGCGREAEPVADAEMAETNPATAQMWVDDFALASANAPAGAAMKTTFAPGEPLQVTMSVDDAPQGASVTTYWFGPNDQPLGYETKSVTAGQDQLSFTHDNTHDWRHGEYRAEIWVGDEKVNEQEFQIIAG